jgi:hypothetical protein
VRGVGAPRVCAYVASLAALCLSGLSARSDDIPTLDVNPVCHGIAQQCVQSEQATREQIRNTLQMGFALVVLAAIVSLFAYLPALVGYWRSCSRPS